MNADQSAGEKSFTITFSDDQMRVINRYRNLGYQISARSISAEGAYGNGYSHAVSYDALNSDGNTVTLTSNAMNLSDGAHTLTIRFMIAVFAEINN